jgi:hypothetical protein
MMYDEYVAKIQKIAAVKHGIYRFRILILSTTAMVLATAGGLVGTKGLVKDETTLEASYVYGEGFHYQSKAFLGEATYEFAQQGNDVWSEEEPSFPGQYKMRAKSANSFSSFYYGKEQDFTILPKPITIACKEDSFVYGSLPSATVLEGLVKEDRLSEDYVFSYSDKSQETWTITPVLESLKILDSSGQDVSAYYTITSEPKEVQILRRDLILSSASKSKIYDGTPLADEGHSLVSGSLVSGDQLALKESASLTEAGTRLNQQSFSIVNADGLDMSKHYNLSYQEGSLTVTKRAISLLGTSHTYTYDGNDKSPVLNDIAMAETSSLAEGETIHYNYLSSDPQIKAGTYVNSFKAQILRGEKDVSANYDITYDFGKTTIEKRTLKVQASSADKIYDGDPLHEEGYTLEEGTLAEKDEVTSIASPSATDAGDYQNDLKFDIADKKSKESFLSSYDIQFTSGSLTIKKRDLTLEITPQSLIYDGLSHQNDYAIKEGSLVKNDAINVVKNATFTDAGTYDNLDFNVDILKGNGTSNLKNYAVTITGRGKAMTIAKRSLSILIISENKTYDGKPFSETLSSTEQRYEIESGTLAENEYIHFSCANDPIDRGEYPMESSIEIYHKKGTEAAPSTDKVVTSNYDLSVEEGKFVVNARNLVITTLDNTHVYNRDTSLAGFERLYSLSGDGLVEGESVTRLTLSCAGINVGAYPYAINEDSLTIKNASGKDVTRNYSVTFINSGKMTITPRDYSVTMQEDSHVYDGKSHPFASYSAENLLEGDYLTFGGNTSLTHVKEGTVMNHPSSVSVFTSENVDVSANYHLTSLKEAGVHIEPRKITLTSADGAKVFDGHPYGDSEVTLSQNPLADGDVLTITNKASATIKNVFETAPNNNSFSYSIANASGEDVLSDYEVTTLYGTITITPCPLGIETIETSITYDGTDHSATQSQSLVTATSSPAYLISGSLPDTYTMSFSQSFASSVILAGDYTQSPTCSCSFFSSRDANVYDSNFAVTITRGTFTIQKREITLQSLAGNKHYDGQPFPDEVRISLGSLAEGDTISFGATTPLITVCENAPNPIGEVTIKNGKGEVVTDSYAIKYIYGTVTIYK